MKPIQGLRKFVQTAVIGGLTVVLPAGILVFIFVWIWGMVTAAIDPAVRKLYPDTTQGSGLIVAQIMVLSIFVIVCFVIGVIVKTAVGRFIHDVIDQRLLARIPGYSIIRETVLQFMGGRKSPFSTVALVNIFGNDILVTGFVTDEHPDGSYTVFIPTGPNPTSGGIFHLKPEYVHIIDQPVEDVMRSIISCGVGSSRMIQEYTRKVGPYGPRPEAFDQVVIPPVGSPDPPQPIKPS